MRSQIRVGDGVTLVVRTDYADDAAWRVLTDRVRAGFEAGAVLVVDDPAWSGAGVEELLAAVPTDDLAVFFVADAVSMAEPHPLSAVSTVSRADCDDEEEWEYETAYGREFRVLPAAVPGVSGGLALAERDFPELAAAAARDDDLVFRGF